MDGKGAWMDNDFIERLWWSLKYECVYINEFEDVRALRRGLDNWIRFYNSKRNHSTLDHRTPDEAYFNNLPKAA
jgi:putative transposase